jgi:tetratricopeptide (TPR) repeat protein
VHRLTQTISWLLMGALLGGCPSTPTKPDEKPGQAASATQGQPDKQVEQVSDQAREAFERAVSAYQAQKKSGRFDYDDLLSRFQAALEVDPKLAEAHYNLGCIYEALRQDEQAQRHFQQALAIRPDLHLAAANLGGLLARHDKLDEALALYQKALSKDAKNSPVLLNMAAIYQKQKKYDLALQRASEVLLRDPTNLGAYRVMASVYYDQDKMDMARLICLRGLQVKQSDPSLHNTLGLVLLRLKRIPEALAQFRAALEQQPDMVPTRFNIAKVALDYKDFRVAKEEFNKILQYQPSNQQASLGLAIATRGTGDYEGARTQFSALAEKHPQDAVLRQWLCRLALRNFNDSKAAKEECGRCIKLNRSKPTDDHPCVAMYKEATQGIEMEKQMKVAEAKAMEEQKRFEEKLAMLAKLRKDTVDQAWDKAKAECKVLPPKKLEGDQFEFVLDPLAITPDQPAQVRLVGAIFKDVARINVGTNKVKWKQLDEHTMTMLVPKGLEEGPWDVLITYKDKSEMYFQGGLWVGKQPDCPKAVEPPAPGQQPPSPGPGDGSGPSKLDGPGGEPPPADAVQPGSAEAAAGAAGPGGKQEQKQDIGTNGGEPEEPQEPAGP